MSQSTLKDYYQGMKMTTFDGTNIYTQIRKMNEDPVGTASKAAARNNYESVTVTTTQQKVTSGSNYNTAGFNQSFGK